MAKKRPTTPADEQLLADIAHQAVEVHSTGSRLLHDREQLRSLVCQSVGISEYRVADAAGLTRRTVRLWKQDADV